ncbi:hypothetical protein MAPG_01849 [Magnaporthiopsis poae ATCC 64411]|uniref:Uncharacterized protein n=1 Tax=Magnaporthiopsis poae (strain ATCC 64411 / 73-15) TaxID=644358 RepID=A0A0C4DPS7_MAGP6|nr:hypothetical protein MAPG_01849 [Magnaporthiopsis poae ATCC 64411]
MENLRASHPTRGQEVRPVTGAGGDQHSTTNQESPATAQYVEDSHAWHSTQGGDGSHLFERPHGHEAGYNQEAAPDAHHSLAGYITSPAIAMWLNQGIKDDPYHTLQSDADATWVAWPAEPVPVDGNVPDQWSVGAAAGDRDPEQAGRRRPGTSKRRAVRRDPRRE